MSKKNNAERSVARTTHLVCASPLGVKYNAATKWKLPVIKETWLLECFKLGKMLPVDSFLLDKNKRECFRDISFSILLIYWAEMECSRGMKMYNFL